MDEGILGIVGMDMGTEGMLGWMRRRWYCWDG